MIKLTIMLAFVCSVVSIRAQENVAATEQVSVEGKVRSSFQFKLSDAGYRSVDGPDSLIIYNHLHVAKRTVKHIRGILLKDLLDKAVIDETNAKLLSTFYIVCQASDGYKVVYSWNEIFNTEIGNHVIIVTSAGGQTGAALPERILLLSAEDVNTGRRFMKGLAKIIVMRVE